MNGTYLCTTAAAFCTGKHRRYCWRANGHEVGWRWKGVRKRQCLENEEHSFASGQFGGHAWSMLSNLFFCLGVFGRLWLPLIRTYISQDMRKYKPVLQNWILSETFYGMYCFHVFACWHSLPLIIGRQIIRARQQYDFGVVIDELQNLWKALKLKNGAMYQMSIVGTPFSRHLQKGKQNHRERREDHLCITEKVMGQ